MMVQCINILLQNSFKITKPPYFPFTPLSLPHTLMEINFTKSTALLMPSLIQNPSMAPHCLQDKEPTLKRVFEDPPFGNDLLE